MHIFAVLTAVALGALAEDWNIISNPGLTINIGIGFRNEQEGFLAGAANGVGNEILHTINGGKNWTALEGNFNNELLLLDLECADETIIVTGALGEMYSKDDGKTWKGSVGGGQSQSIRYFGKDGEGGEKFGAAGFYLNGQGAAVTRNGGEFFTKAFDRDLFTDIRYGAYPSDDVWYLTAGEFPGETPDDDEPNDDLPDDKMARRMQRTVHMDENGHFKLNGKQTRPGYRNGTDNGYKAQLVKTADGGKTWETQIAVNNSYYFNGIDCTSENHCCAVGEAADPPYLGAGIHCTFDGGKTWDQTFYMPYEQREGFSLIDIRFANDQVGWAVGGELVSIAPKAYFVETLDGGKTWNADKHVIFGYYALGLEVVNENLAFAALDDTITQQSGVARWTSS